MFVLAFEAIFNFIFWAAIIYGIYRLAFRNSLTKEAEIKTAKDSASKLAIVKLYCNDYKDVENFINKNAQHLSEEMIKKLADHLESLRAEFILNKKFLDLDIPKRVAMDLEEQENITEFSSISNGKI